MRRCGRSTITVLTLICLAPLLTAGICGPAVDEARSREKVRILTSAVIGGSSVSRGKVPGVLVGRMLHMQS